MHTTEELVIGCSLRPTPGADFRVKRSERDVTRCACRIYRTRLAKMKILLMLFSGLCLQACVVKTAIGVAGDVVEGAAKTTGAVVDAGVDAVDSDGDDDL